MKIKEDQHHQMLHNELKIVLKKVKKNRVLVLLCPIETQEHKQLMSNKAFAKQLQHLQTVNFYQSRPIISSK